MAVAEGKVPILESAGQAVRFLRSNWRFVLIVAASSTAAQLGVLLTLGFVPLAFFAAFVAVAAATYAALTSAALEVERTAPTLTASAGRVAGAVSIVGVLLAIMSMLLLLVAMSILIAPHANEMKAAGEDTAVIQAIMERAIQAQPNLILSMLGFGAVLWFLITSRLYLAVPGSVDEKRIAVFDTWAWTKGNLFRISAARLCVLGPALILVSALQQMIAFALNLNLSGPVELAGQAQSNPGGFLAFYAGATFVQIAILSALEAGLSTYLYRGLKPAAAP